MRVLLTTDTVGGAWTYALELAGGLAHHHVEVVLAAIGPSIRDDQRARARALPNVRLEFHPGALEWMQDPWRDVDATGDWLLALAERHAPSVVHLGSYAHAALPFPAPIIVMAHSCVLSWYDAVRGTPAPRELDEYRRRVQVGLDAADAVVAPTWAMMAGLVEHYGPLRSCRVIANGRRPEAFPAGAKQPFILCAGRVWDEAKNIAAVARAASSLPWPVYVAGDAAHPEGGARELPGVVSLGHLDEATLAKWLGRAAIYVSPARYEPFGLGVLEAALARCALVLGDIPSQRELWLGAAELVSPDDDAGLVASIEALVHAPSIRERRGRAAQVRAARMTTARMAARYRALYGELAERTEPSVSTTPISSQWSG